MGERSKAATISWETKERHGENERRRVHQLWATERSASRDDGGEKIRRSNEGADYK